MHLNIGNENAIIANGENKVPLEADQYGCRPVGNANYDKLPDFV